MVGVRPPHLPADLWRASLAPGLQCGRCRTARAGAGAACRARWAADHELCYDSGEYNAQCKNSGEHNASPQQAGVQPVGSCRGAVEVKRTGVKRTGAGFGWAPPLSERTKMFCPPPAAARARARSLSGGARPNLLQLCVPAHVASRARAASRPAIRAAAGATVELRAARHVVGELGAAATTPSLRVRLPRASARASEQDASRGRPPSR